MVSTHQVAGSTPAGGATGDQVGHTWYMRRLVPYLLLAIVTAFSGAAAVSSSMAPQRDQLGLLPTTSIPWGVITDGWMIGEIAPLDMVGRIETRESTHFLFSPSGERYRLPIKLSSRTSVEAWSNDGRYVATVQHDATALRFSRLLEVRDLRTWKVVSRMAVGRTGDAGGDQPGPYITSVAFFGPGRNSLLVTYSNVDLANGIGVDTTETYVSYVVDTSHQFAKRVGKGLPSDGSVQPRPDGRVVSIGGLSVGGLSIARMTTSGWTTASLGAGSCSFVKWWTPTAILAACELQVNEMHEQLFAYNIDDGSRTAVSPVPGAMFSDADRGNRSFAWAYSDAYQVKGKTFVHAVPTCGPGWVEVVHGGEGHVIAGTGGDIFGATRDALILEVMRGECMGHWAIVRLEAETLKQRTLVTFREWARRDVSWHFIQSRYGAFD